MPSTHKNDVADFQAFKFLIDSEDRTRVSFKRPLMDEGHADEDFFDTTSMKLLQMILND